MFRPVLSSWAQDNIKGLGKWSKIDQTERKGVGSNRLNYAPTLLKLWPNKVTGFINIPPFRVESRGNGANAPFALIISRRDCSTVGKGSLFIVAGSNQHTSKKKFVDD